jgi:hypothetical protein
VSSESSPAASAASAKETIRRSSNFSASGRLGVSTSARRSSCRYAGNADGDRSSAPEEERSTGSTTRGRSRCAEAKERIASAAARVPTIPTLTAPRWKLSTAAASDSSRTSRGTEAKREKEAVVCTVRHEATAQA